MLENYGRILVWILVAAFVAPSLMSMVVLMRTTAAVNSAFQHIDDVESIATSMSKSEVTRRTRQLKKLLAPQNAISGVASRLTIAAVTFEGLNQDRLEAAKAAREAKVYTTWLSPNEEHEAALHRFTEAILSSDGGNRFLPKFREFQQNIAYFGALNSLTQTLLMMTCPGIPDFYQNTTIWDLTLVDPDNRRPVEIDTRLQLAEEVSAWTEQSAAAAQLLRSWTDGRIKTYLIHRVLQFRCDHPEFFIEANYAPLDATGTFANNVIAFERSRDGEHCIVVAPRFCTRLVKAGKPPVGAKVWRDTAVPAIEGEWRNVITGERVTSQDVGSVLQTFPMALLTNFGF